MHVNCEQHLLCEGLTIVQKAISSKTPLPVLSGIFVQTTKDGLRLVTNDMQFGIEYNVKAQIIEEGAMVLPARYLVELIRRVPVGDIELRYNIENRTCEIKYGLGKGTLHGFDPETYPFLPEQENPEMIVYEAKNFRRAVQEVAFAASGEDVRPVFNGILMDFEENKLTLVATDSHRLAIRYVRFEGPLGPVEFKKMIVPGRVFSEINRVLEIESAPVTMYVSEDQIIFKGKDIKFIIRLIAGKYPEYMSLVPEQWQTRIVTKAKDLLSAVERAALLGREDNPGGVVVLHIGIKEGEVQLQTRSHEVGFLEERVPASCQGEDGEIALNARYLIEALRAMDSDEIVISLTGNQDSPLVIRKKEQDDYVCLILPIKI